MKNKYKRMCSECGEKRYPKKRELGAITVSLGKCSVCGKNKGIIPARDWAYQAGESIMWD